MVILLPRKEVVTISPRDVENSERINVFLSPEALNQLKGEAKEKGMTVSGIVRMIVLEHLKQKE